MSVKSMPATGLLTRDAILGALDAVTERVKVPEWGGEVIIRSLTGKERDQFEASIVSIQGSDVRADMQKAIGMRARLVAMTLVDEAGDRLFAEGDVSILQDKNAQVINRLFDVARRLSGLTNEDVEELEGN